ncbi:MAG: cadherin repeat domain-containing protein [Proteobacteria bacterium]|nr:cadherin repeat domain-containing protein [Pseudomonadota bacterium]
MKKLEGPMKGFLPVGFTLAILGLASCYASNSKPGKETTKSHESNAVSASGTINSKGFALTLPDLPGTSVEGLRARVRIFHGQLKRPEVMCPQPNPDKPTSSSGGGSPGGSPAPSTGLANESTIKSEDPIKEPNLAVVDVSIEYKAGLVVGPFALSQGSFTVFFDVMDSTKDVLTGTGFFEVTSGSESVVNLILKRIKPCDQGPGSVIIKPTEETPDSTEIVPACNFLRSESFPCTGGESAKCRWNTIESKQMCSADSATQSLIALLCSQGAKVAAASFLNEILCESTVTPPSKENLPPLAFDSTFSTKVNMPVDIQLVAKDPEGDPLRYVIVQQPKFGVVKSLDQDTGIVVYVAQSMPQNDTVDKIVFAVEDRQGRRSNTATLFIHVSN